MRKEAEEILADESLGTATGWTAVSSKIPSSGMKRVGARVETLKSKTGFATLQAMREASKTGGALGQISDKENELLQTNISSLDRSMSTNDFKESLKRIIQHTIDSEERLQRGFNETYGNESQPTTPYGGQKKNNDDGDILNQLINEHK